jgi:cytoskeletal protein CcmA (bactofilin family)
VSAVLWLLLLVLANAALFGLPLLPALLEWRKRGNAPLFIPADDEAGIGYFAERFRQRLAADWDSATLFEREGDVEFAQGLQAAGASLPGSIVAQYRIVSGDVVGVPTLATAEQPTLVGDVIRLVRGTHQLGEIYAREQLDAPGGSVIRAALCDGAMHLGPGSGILRWAHGVRVEAGAGSRMMGRVSAREVVALDAGCRFERLSAPELRFAGGAPDQDATAMPTRRWVADAKARVAHEAGGRLLCTGDVAIPAGSLVDGHLIVRGKLTLGAGCHVTGGIKVHGPLTLGEGTRVTGAMFATGEIRIGAHCAVDGPVSSARGVRLASDCRVGRKDRPTSLVAPNVSIGHRCTCHGSLWARTNGRVDG